MDRRRSARRAPVEGSRAGTRAPRHVPPAGRATVAAPRQRRAIVGVCCALAAAIWLAFGQVREHGLVNYDDDAYVHDNPVVRRGITGDGIVWAFTRTHAANWHPLTWLSHMLDCQVFGAQPAGHHLTSLLLHLAAAILLFLVLREMTGALWRSAFLALAFAIHPLRVESVPWISERKDVLSALCFMLAIGAYVGSVRHPRSRARCLAVVPRCSAPAGRPKPCTSTGRRWTSIRSSPWPRAALPARWCRPVHCEPAGIGPDALRPRLCPGRQPGRLVVAPSRGPRAGRARRPALARDKCRRLAGARRRVRRDGACRRCARRRP